MPEPPRSALAQDLVLWDMIAEHLAGTEFLLKQHARYMDSPIWTLKDLERRLEPTFAAHLDGLVVGGAAAYERLFAPVLSEPDPENVGKVTVAALVALAAARFADLKPALGHDDASVRAAVVDACSLSGGPAFESWLGGRMRDPLKNAERASLLHVLGRRGMAAPVLIEWLQGDDRALARAAAEAARGADARKHLAVMDYLLEHEDAGVREAALVVALAWGSQRATILCERWALETEVERPLPMALYAALGGATHHGRLARKLPIPRQRRGTLFALGFSGDPETLALLVDALTDKDEAAAKIAAQGVSMMTGLDLHDARFASKVDPAAPGGGGNVPQGEGDLDTDLAPVPEEALPRLDATEVRRFCAAKAQSFKPGRRYLAGREVMGDFVLDYLDEAPLRQRHVLALAESIRRGGRAWIDTRGFSRDQRRRTAAAKAAGRRGG
jgi:uncharacterized protein (TIGR02270 family)